MRKLLNTLYVMSPDQYLSLDGENIVILENEKESGRIPLHNLEAVASFGYRGVSPALMGACADRGISLSFLTPQGKFLAQVQGSVRGNVVLRKKQYAVSEDKIEALRISKNCILGKIYNSRGVLERACRDHPLQVDTSKIKRVTDFLKQSIDSVKACGDLDRLRGYEGEAASLYFSVLDELILQQKKIFYFHGRNKRPPMDIVNAMLSFSYTLLTGMCRSALEIVGLDPYVGFMHTDRPGRISLALDMVEELRSVFADRFVLTLINRKMVSQKDFTQKENGAVFMNDTFRKNMLVEWQNKKKEIISHPYLKEKVEWGMVPFVQAMLLARYLRGDIDTYPPFFWK